MYSKMRFTVQNMYSGSIPILRGGNKLELNRVAPTREYVDMKTGELMLIETIARSTSEALIQYDPKRKRNGKVPTHVQLKTAKKALRKLFSLSWRDRGFLLSLMPFVGWESNILMGHDELGGIPGQPLTWPDIDAICKVDRRTRYEIVKELERRKFIGYIEIDGHRNAIMIHPDYVQFGSRIVNDIRAAFDADKSVEEDGE